MSVKKHLVGGTLRDVMVAEIKRCLQKYQNHEQPTTAAALELGVSPKTLNLWKGPPSKGGWQELQPKDIVDTFVSSIKPKSGRPKNQY